MFEVGHRPQNIDSVRERTDLNPMDIDYTCIFLLRNVWFWTKIRLALGEEVWVH